MATKDLPRIFLSHLEGDCLAFFWCSDKIITALHITLVDNFTNDDYRILRSRELFGGSFWQKQLLGKAAAGRSFPQTDPS
uniref:Uncharacterized protein n=1 Tax=Oryza brachyantha TaxID=4533 RepID=J3MB70_ORYBR